MSAYRSSSKIVGFNFHNHTNEKIYIIFSNLVLIPLYVYLLNPFNLSKSVKLRNTIQTQNLQNSKFNFLESIF